MTGALVILPPGTHGYDSSFAHPSVDEMVRQGGRWREGYISNDSRKDITSWEIAQAAGVTPPTGTGTFGIMPIYETFEGWWRGPSLANPSQSAYDAGKAAAYYASDRCLAFGIPAGTPIRYTIDQGVSTADLHVAAECFSGIADANTDYAIHGYGPANVMEYLYAYGLVGGYTQWGGDGGYLSPSATMHQPLAQQHGVAGADELVVSGDPAGSGAGGGAVIWMPGVTTPPPMTRDQACAFALAMVGVREGGATGTTEGSNDVLFTRWADKEYGWVTVHSGGKSLRTRQAWCGSFLFFVGKHAGANWGRANLFAVGEDVADAQTDGRWRVTGPRKGDWIHYHSTDGHEGMVVDVRADGSVRTVEGNWLNRVVQFENRDLTDLWGYTRVDYIDDGVVTNPPSSEMEYEMSESLFRVAGDQTFFTARLVADGGKFAKTHVTSQEYTILNAAWKAGQAASGVTAITDYPVAEVSQADFDAIPDWVAPVVPVPSLTPPPTAGSQVPGATPIDLIAVHSAVATGITAGLTAGFAGLGTAIETAVGAAVDKALPAR